MGDEPELEAYDDTNPDFMIACPYLTQKVIYERPFVDMIQRTASIHNHFYHMSRFTPSAIPY